MWRNEIKRSYDDTVIAQLVDRFSRVLLHEDVKNALSPAAFNLLSVAAEFDRTFNVGLVILLSTSRHCTKQIARKLMPQFRFVVRVISIFGGTWPHIAQMALERMQYLDAPVRSGRCLAEEYSAVRHNVLSVDNCDAYTVLFTLWLRERPFNRCGRLSDCRCSDQCRDNFCLTVLRAMNGGNLFREMRNRWFQTCYSDQLNALFTSLSSFCPSCRDYSYKPHSMCTAVLFKGSQKKVHSLFRAAIYDVALVLLAADLDAYCAAHIMDYVVHTMPPNARKCAMDACGSDNGTFGGAFIGLFVRAQNAIANIQQQKSAQ